VVAIVRANAFISLISVDIIPFVIGVRGNAALKDGLPVVLANKGCFVCHSYRISGLGATVTNNSALAGTLILHADTITILLHI
jgi:hypothetical protein